MIGHNSKHPNVEPFQIFNILSKEDFEKVLIEKDNYLPKTIGGSYSKLLNFKYDQKQIGIFAKVCDVIRNTLISKGFENPKVTTFDFLNHVGRKFMPFHKHWIMEGVNPYEKNDSVIPYEYFWVAIFYPHNLYEKEYAGKITVRLDENTEGHTFESVPNSIVLHNGLYGHEVEIEELHPTIIRDACFTQWICKYTK